MQVYSGRGRYLPKKFIKPETQYDQLGFWDFQSEPVKKCLKSARIGAALGRLARVGRIGQVLPTPNQKV
jgi:hypothetical protein